MRYRILCVLMPGGWYQRPGNFGSIGWQSSRLSFGTQSPCTSSGATRCKGHFCKHSTAPTLLLIGWSQMKNSWWPMWFTFMLISNCTMLPAVYVRWGSCTACT
jgi:hypothetical protein